MRTICLSLAALLLSTSLAPLAAAGVAEDATNPNCDPNMPILDYIICYLNLGGLVDRIEAEANWQVAYIQSVGDYYEGKALNVTYTGIDAGAAQLYLTTLYVRDVDAAADTFVSYVNGVPFRVTTYVNGVVEGECQYYLETPCPVPSGWATREGALPDLVTDSMCNPSGSPVAYVVCKVEETKAELELLIANLQAHYTGVAYGAVDFVYVNGLDAAVRVLVLGITVYAETVYYAFGTTYNAVYYGGKLVAETDGVVPFTVGIAKTECGRVTSQCPYLLDSIRFDLGGYPVLA